MTAQESAQLSADDGKSSGLDPDSSNIVSSDMNVDPEEVLQYIKVLSRRTKNKNRRVTPSYH